MNGKGWGMFSVSATRGNTSTWERTFPISHYLDLALNTQEVSILTGPAFLQLHPRAPWGSGGLSLPAGWLPSEVSANPRALEKK